MLLNILQIGFYASLISIMGWAIHGITGAIIGGVIGYSIAECIKRLTLRFVPSNIELFTGDKHKKYLDKRNKNGCINTEMFILVVYTTIESFFITMSVLFVISYIGKNNYSLYLLLVNYFRKITEFVFSYYTAFDYYFDILFKVEAFNRVEFIKIVVVCVSISMIYPIMKMVYITPSCWKSFYYILNNRQFEINKINQAYRPIIIICFFSFWAGLGIWMIFFIPGNMFAITGSVVTETFSLFGISKFVIMINAEFGIIGISLTFIVSYIVVMRSLYTKKVGHD